MCLTITRKGELTRKDQFDLAIRAVILSNFYLKPERNGKEVKPNYL